MRSDCAEGRAGYWCLKGNQAEYAAKNVSLTHKKSPAKRGMSLIFTLAHAWQDYLQLLDNLLDSAGRYGKSSHSLVLQEYQASVEW